MPPTGITQGCPCGLSAQPIENIGQLVKLGKIGHRREEHQLIASCLFIAANKLSNRLRICQEISSDLLGEWPGESVVISHVAQASSNSIIAERKVALRPELWPTRASEVAPGGTSFVGGAAKRPGWPPTMHIAIRITGHASKPR